MAERWIIVADDLTGAADCAIPFARRGASASVYWAAAGAGESEILSYDAATRGLPAAEAAARHRRLLAALPRQGRRIFKKIDSTLRGQPAAEIAAILPLTGRRAVCAPAFPALRRTTEGGRVFVAGVPLESTGLWKSDHTYADADLTAVLATSGLVVQAVPLDTVRAGKARLVAVLRESGVAVCDAGDDGDLDRIAAAASALGEDCLWIGSAGLAHALARAGWQGRPMPLPVEPRPGGILVVAGSRAAATQEAVACLASTAGVRAVGVSPAALLEAGSPEWSRAVAAVAAGLATGDVLLHVAGGENREGHAADISDALGRIGATAAGAIGGLVATGGETAAALLRHLGVDGIRLADEVEAGVPLGLTLGRVAIPLVTKAGAFGDGGTLRRALFRLREVRRKGKTA